MSDYPDLEEVPAWGSPIPPDFKVIAVMGSEGEGPPYKPVLNPRWLTGLVQFVRAVQRPLEERIASLEREARELGWEIGQEDKPTPPARTPEGVDRFIENVREAWSPDSALLAERLAREAAEAIHSKNPNGTQCFLTQKKILPFFRRATEGQGGGA